MLIIKNRDYDFYYINFEMVEFFYCIACCLICLSECSIDHRWSFVRKTNIRLKSHLWSTIDGRCWASDRCSTPWKSVRPPRRPRRRCSGWTQRNWRTRTARVPRCACPAFSSRPRCPRPRPFQFERLKPNAKI